MSYMNLTLGVITYEDQNVNSPQIRTLDINRTMLGIPVTSEQTSKIENLAPGESRVVAATTRSLTQDNTSLYAITHPWSADVSTVRLLNISGTASGFATKRNLSIDATTVISINRINPATCRVQSVAGTAINTTAVQVGDILKFEKNTDLFISLFATINQASFRVLAKGTGYIDVAEDGVMSEDQSIVLGSNYDIQMRCFSNGSVKVNDILEIMGTGQNPNNIGKFKVLNVSYDYVEFANPYAVDLTFTNSNNVQVYDRLMGFIFIRAISPVTVIINDGAPLKLEKLSSQGEAMFIGSVQAFKIELRNDETLATSATVHYSSVY